MLAADDPGPRAEHEVRLANDVRRLLGRIQGPDGYVLETSFDPPVAD